MIRLRVQPSDPHARKHTWQTVTMMSANHRRMIKAGRVRTTESREPKRSLARGPRDRARVQAANPAEELPLPVALEARLGGPFCFSPQKLEAQCTPPPGTGLSAQAKAV
jgi:hypothetical protein